MIWSRASQITTSLDRLVDATRGADDTKYDGLKKPSLVDAVYNAIRPLLAWSPGLADAAETAIHRWPACRQRRCTSIGGGGEAAPGGAGGVRRAGAGPGSHALPDGQPPVARHTCSHVVLGAVRQPCDWGPAHRRVSLQREPSLVPGYQMGMITQHCLQLPCSRAAAPGTISYPVQTEIQLSPLAGPDLWGSATWLLRLYRGNRVAEAPLLRRSQNFRLQPTGLLALALGCTSTVAIEVPSAEKATWEMWMGTGCSSMAAASSVFVDATFRWPTCILPISVSTFCI